MDAVDQLPLADLGQTIARLRRDLNWSTHRLAVNAGVSDPYLRRVEAGDATPGIDVLSRIATALKVSVPKLLADAGFGSAPLPEGELGALYIKLGPIERRALVRTAHTLREIQLEYAQLQARDEPAEPRTVEDAGDDDPDAPPRPIDHGDFSEEGFARRRRSGELAAHEITEETQAAKQDAENLGDRT